MTSVLAIVAAREKPARQGKLSINWLDSLSNHAGELSYRPDTDGIRLRIDRLRGGAMDPSPDYDTSDEIEFFMRYLTWGLRGVQDGNGYPPPAYPPV
jgi:hypothetical protein